jgi:hypothetical protein
MAERIYVRRLEDGKVLNVSRKLYDRQLKGRGFEAIQDDPPKPRQTKPKIKEE